MSLNRRSRTLLQWCTIMQIHCESHACGESKTAGAHHSPRISWPLAASRKQAPICTHSVPLDSAGRSDSASSQAGSGCDCIMAGSLIVPRVSTATTARCTTVSCIAQKCPGHDMMTAACDAKAHNEVSGKARICAVRRRQHLGHALGALLVPRSKLGRRLHLQGTGRLLSHSKHKHMQARSERTQPKVTCSTTTTRSPLRTSLSTAHS